tara:strand:+ start:85 stop:495 length:411 start_codon:yes stop_codon:yes gene_type:complete
MELYNKLNFDLQYKIDYKVKKIYFKNQIAPQIENHYKLKKIKLIPINYLSFHDYTYYLSLLETNILYYLNDKQSLMDSLNIYTQQFLTYFFNVNITNYNDYKLVSSHLDKKDLVIKLLNTFTVQQIDEFYDIYYNK